MNFFEAQARSQRNSRYLLWLFIAATLIVVVAVTLAIVAALLFSTGQLFSTNPLIWMGANLQFIGLTGLGVLTFILLASLIRIAGLREGGGRVATDMGATPVAPETTNQHEIVLRNVVEEMALASGTPVPQIFVMQEEAGINAFAAGFKPEDAAIAVTRGTLQKLNREELQGVIAHEFSHILNGDMRINIQLMGPLYGISAIALLGRIMLRGGRRPARGKKSGGGIVALGLALVITGYSGLFCARMIKAAVSRQREFLADASAVQFTRQVEGILNALKKIGGHSTHSRLDNAQGEEISHMLFANGGRRALTRMLATHPPLRKRIDSLDPNGLYGSRIPDAMEAEASIAEDDDVLVSALNADTLVQSIGQPDARSIEAAENIHAGIALPLLDAARSTERAPLLAFAIILHPDDVHRAEQMTLLQQKLGETRANIVTDLYGFISAGLPDNTAAPELRMALLELCFPALKRRPPSSIEFTLDVLEELIQRDQKIELFEYTLTRTLYFYLERADNPAAKSGTKTFKNRFTRSAALFLIAVLASRTATGDPIDALRCGLNKLKCPPESSDAERQLLKDATGKKWAHKLDKSLQRLQLLNMEARARLVTALLHTANQDKQLNNKEIALLQAICAILESPLPAQLEEN